MVKFAAFDLDGTLIDSLGGIANAVNLTRADYNLAPLPVETIAAWTGDGAKKLLERSLAGKPLPGGIDEAVTVMIRHYTAHPVCGTTLYADVYDGLETLYRAGWILAVVSNKPAAVGRLILRHFGLDRFIADQIGGGDGFPLKPAPEAFLHLLAKHRAVPAASFLAGDHHTDMDAAASAGMKGVFCRYGFGRKAHSNPAIEVDSFAELTAVIGR